MELVTLALSLLAAALAAPAPPDAPPSQPQTTPGYETRQASPMRTAPTQGTSRMNIEGRAIDFYMKKPLGEGTWPGVVLLHDSRGLSTSNMKLVDKLSSEGFIVMAPDLYGGKVALDDDKGRELSVLMDQEAALATIEVLAAHLRATGDVGDHRVGLLGFDLGGRLALQGAIGSRDISAVAVAYSRSPGDADTIRRVSCPVLGIFAGKDGLIPPRETETLREALQAAGRSAQTVVYEEAGHGFMKEGEPEYDTGAAAAAWSRIVGFLRENL